VAHVWYLYSYPSRVSPINESDILALRIAYGTAVFFTTAEASCVSGGSCTTLRLASRLKKNVVP
jgi:hypothetical protein